MAPTGPLFAPQSVGTSFEAVSISDTSGDVPPDSMGDVGPTQILAIANGRIRVFSKTGVLGGLDVDTRVFFASVGGISGVTHPHVRYDRISGRWFVVMVNLDTPDSVLIAASNGPTITSTSSFSFFSFQFDTVGPTPNSDTGGFFDYPSLGVDRNALYIGGNVYNAAGTAQLGTTGFVVKKADLLAGTLTVTAFRQLVAGGAGAGPFAPQGVDNDDPGATQGFFIGVDNASFSTLMIRRVSNPGGSPTISANISLSVPTTYFPLPQPAKNSTTPLAALDDRLFAASIHKNKISGAINLWTAHNIRVSAAGIGGSGGTRNGSRWYEITNLGGTPSLVQSGTLFDPAAANPRGFWIPAVAASGQGHMALGSSYAGTLDFAGVATAGRLRSDPSGTIQAATLAVVSSTAYNLNDQSNPHRWGEYSQIDVDPNDDQTLWTFQEYCNNTDSWGVRAIQLIAAPPATPSSATSACTGQGEINVIVAGTSSGGSEFFDPGPDTGGPGFANHLTASVTGGVVVNSASFVDPTHVTLKLDTMGATQGTQDVTITNPDGQTATGTGILIVGTTPATPTASNNGPVCEGATLQLSASTIAGANYVWTGPNDFFSTEQNPAIFGVTARAEGTYHVVATVGGCSSSEATTAVTVIGDGRPCDDGQACTLNDLCQAGSCQGSPVVCTASDQCHTAGTCNPATGICTNPVKPDGTACSDGNACTQADMCQSGACTPGSPVVCTASDQCHMAGTCSPATGICSNPAKPNGTSCNDGTACTQTDTCQSGSCTGGNPVVCTASDQCHLAGTCNPATGICSNPAKPDGASCTDGNPCTQGDTCHSGACASGSAVVCTASDQCHVAGVCSQQTGICSNPVKPDGAPCNDGSACTQPDTCQTGICTGANPVVCTASDQCHDVGTCNPGTGVCSNPAKPNGTSCNDGSLCTQPDTCQSGTCTGSPVVCTPSDQCHQAGVCDPANGSCSNPEAPDGTSCTNDNLCTQTDTCQTGICRGGNPVVCTPIDQCHSAGVCNPATGLCSNPAKPNGTSCNDGSVCTQVDTCQGGICTGGSPVPDGTACSDGNGCTVNDACASGVCTGTAITVPSEVTGLIVHANKQTLTWNSASQAGPGTVHDVPRGRVSGLPVGSGAPEICLASGISVATTTDSSTPPVGDSFWYLVRGRNSCGMGSYGNASNGLPRITAACP